MKISEIWDLITLELYQTGFSLLCWGNCSSFENQLRCFLLCEAPVMPAGEFVPPYSRVPQHQSHSVHRTNIAIVCFSSLFQAVNWGEAMP